MITYEYKGYDRSGRVSRGLVEALNPKEARELLAEQGVLTETLAKTGRRISISSERRSSIYRDLSILLSAGLTLTKAMEILIAAPDRSGAHLFVAAVRDRVREGVPLAKALAESSPAVTAFEVAVIEAAERSASLEALLARLAEFLDEQERLRERVRGALTYPAIVLALGFCLTVVMFTVLLPRAREMLSAGNLPVPALTRGMMAATRAVALGGIPAVLLAAAGWAWMRRRLRGDPELRQRWDRRVFRLPVWGTGYTILAGLRFTRTLTLLLRGGVRLTESLPLAGRATGSPWIAALSAQAAEALRHGARLSSVVAQIPPIAACTGTILEVGEAGGKLDDLLDGAGERLQARWNAFIARTLVWVEVVPVILVGGFVLLVTLSVLLPVIRLARAIP